MAPCRDPQRSLGHDVHRVRRRGVDAVPDLAGGEDR